MTLETYTLAELHKKVFSGAKRGRLKPLTRDQHLEVARLLNQAQDCIDAATQIACHAKGARYTDASLRARRDIQTKLIDPLRFEWEDKHSDPTNYNDNPYQSVGYGARR